RGRHSYLARAPEIGTHASTLKPFGAWWIWLLGLALIVLAPLGVGAAIRSALPGDVPAYAPAAAWPSERVRRRAASIPGWAIVAAGVAVIALWLIFWAINTHSFQNDEDQYLYLSRWVPLHLPQSLWAFVEYGRGLQRLEVWLLAVPGVLFDAPWSLGVG